MTLGACARCHVLFYCSEPCQAQHWKLKPGGHKKFCITKDERRPVAMQPNKKKSKVNLLRSATSARFSSWPFDQSPADCCSLLPRPPRSVRRRPEVVQYQKRNPHAPGGGISRA